MIKNEIVRIVEKIQEICTIQKTNNPIHSYILIAKTLILEGI